MHNYAGYLVSKSVRAIKFNNEVSIFLLKITNVSAVLDFSVMSLSIKHYLTGSFKIINISI